MIFTKGSSSRFMNRMSRILLFVLLSCLSHEVCTQPVPETGKLLSTGNAFDKAEMRNFWNSGRNAAGLRQDTVTVSYAGVAGEYETGGFRDYWEAESSWSAGAMAGTITHLDRISMSGTFSFENFSGEGMCGSMSARPGYYPVDVLEFTPGGKTRQTYSFSGGISADAGSHWRIGGKIEYTGMNYTKRKDLRHTNYLLDMTVVPSAMYHDGDFAILGREWSPSVRVGDRRFPDARTALRRCIADAMEILICGNRIPLRGRQGRGEADRMVQVFRTWHLCAARIFFSQLRG